ncbi:MAG: PH domain-containing protein [Anaerolineales bacterium]|jgi:hypothetical protein|nr:PH domain-containing protein [Anaerolineales bacterium]
MKEPRVYKSSPMVFVVLLVSFALLFGGIIFGVGLEGISFTLPMVAIIMLLLVLAFVAQFAKVTVSDEEISIQNLFGVKSLRWAEVDRVSGRGYALKLHDRDEGVKMSINPQLPGYEEIVEFAGVRRPDLFSPNQYSDMKRGVTVYVLIFLFVTLILGISLFYVYVTMDSPNTSPVEYLPLLVFVLITIAFGSMVFSVPRALTLDGNTMGLKYILGERTIRADEIAIVQFRFTQSRNGRHYFVNLSLHNRKNIQLKALGVGLPIAYLVLKNWHRSHTQGQQSVPENVAPNWSDNSNSVR